MATIDCKVVLLGSPSVGKTCLLERYLHGQFSNNTQATIAGSFAAKKEVLQNVSVVLGCWDTAGSERYASISRMYYRNARAAIVCFDLTDRSTYENARHWVSELLAEEQDCKVYFCGTKLDLVVDKPDLRQVDKKRAQELAHDLQTDYFETSSKTGENIEPLFKKIAKDYSVWESNDVCSRLNVNDSIKIHQSSWKNDPRVRREGESGCCIR
ncbi:ras-related protein Rab-24-like [Mercenaria mercenaria]|uniref:ras-related protein Rab-24-like n=1 Tax=Mercenaria mercenaria TaxID=6596 RepID=UPI00234F231B|nr:ras-related protein Rab-24-like [Mercenaria mercenaria]